MTAVHGKEFTSVAVSQTARPLNENTISLTNRKREGEIKPEKERERERERGD